MVGTLNRRPLEDMRGDKEELRDWLERVGAKFTKDGKTCLCPWHNDKTPSAGIFEKGGVWKFKCHVCQIGGDVFDIMARVSKTPVEEIIAKHGGAAERREIVTQPERQEKTCPSANDWVKAYRETHTVEKVYPYLDAAGKNPLMVVIRMIGADGKKTFRQISPRRNGWVAARPEGKLPLYGLEQIAANDCIVVCEGEKAADAVRNAGWWGVTSPMGSGKAKEADWRPLAGKRVVIWPDNDQPGLNHAYGVLEELEALDPRPEVSMLDPKLYELPEKGDAFDLWEMWVGRYKNEELVRELFADALGEATPQDGSRYVFSHVEDAISGKLENIPFPFYLLGELTQALMPGTVTMICGDPSVSKTFLNLQCMSFWEERGIKATAHFFEDDKQLYMVRATAQKAKCGDFTKPAFAQKNQDRARQIVKEQRDFNNRMAKRIFVESDEERIPTYAKVLEWIEERAKLGDQIILLDPITAIGVGAARANEDLAFLMKAKSLARRYGFRLVLVTHPKQNKELGICTSAMAGGAAYERFTHTIFWISFLEHEIATKVRTSSGERELNINRAIHLLKTRNGEGKGMSIAYHFEPSSLTFVEQGMIVKKPKRQKGQ